MVGTRKIIALLLTIVLGTAAATIIYLAVLVLDAAKIGWVLSGRLKDEGTTLVYLPAGLIAGKKVPLVFTLSPSADALGMITAWAPVAEKHGWIIAASKQFRNGIDFLPSLQATAAELDQVESKYSVDPKRVIFSGLSGGGMGSHAVAKYYPDRVSAIVINTGMMQEGMMSADYPSGKLAVFLASPTDFRFQEMHRDRIFLESHQWTTLWLEFEGGHTMAPIAVYQQAADWLEKNLP